MFQIKICGVTTVEDARQAVELGSDIIGLNFYPASPRYVSLEVAAAIAASVPQSAGVFVNSTAEQINSIASTVGLAWVQLHGDEPPELLADLRDDLPIIRVHSLGEGGMSAIAADLQACRSRGREPAALLIDATVPGQYGGTGKTVDWQALQSHQDRLGDIPLILAGGLHPGNVAEAITTVLPTAVDTASGVESVPGVKDSVKMQSFIQAAKQGFRQIGR